MVAAPDDTVSMIERRELCAAIGNKEGEQIRGFGCTRILTDEMFAAGWLEETHCVSPTNRTMPRGSDSDCAATNTGNSTPTG